MTKFTIFFLVQTKFTTLWMLFYQLLNFKNRLNKIFQRTKYGVTQCQFNNLHFRTMSEDTLTEGSDYMSIH
jgi:lipopolysaccharide/colanic/teichoic acid biosynthesis glycosyltransferase